METAGRFDLLAERRRHLADEEWTDTRACGHSPWSPPWYISEAPKNGKWLSQVTFSEPGEYVLRAVASDGALFTYSNVTIVVTR